MTVVSIALLAGLGAMAVIILTARRRLEMTELGTVSEQWLAEHHANDRHHPAR